MNWQSAQDSTSVGTPAKPIWRSLQIVLLLEFLVRLSGGEMEASTRMMFAWKETTLIAESIAIVEPATSGFV